MNSLWDQYRRPAPGAARAGVLLDYLRCADGFYRKQVTFWLGSRPRGDKREDMTATETMVRDELGRLVHVERSQRSRTLALKRNGGVR